MKIYTRTGDEGSTALFGGGRVLKSHPRVAAYGDVDELNSVLGWALTQLSDEATKARLGLIQHDLFRVGAHLATPPAVGDRSRPAVPDLPAERVAEMEAWMDGAESALAPLRDFILPGGTSGAAALHLARTVCRRAERSIVDLSAEEEVEPEVLRYLNRLSDLLFTFARLENAGAGRGDVLWHKSGRGASGGGAP